MSVPVVSTGRVWVAGVDTPPELSDDGWTQIGTIDELGPTPGEYYWPEDLEKSFRETVTVLKESFTRFALTVEDFDLKPMMLLFGTTNTRKLTRNYRRRFVRNRRRRNR